MSFATDMVTKYEGLLATHAGMKSVSVDGQSVTYDELEKQYEFWVKKAGAEAGTRPRLSKINLSGF